MTAETATEWSLDIGLPQWLLIPVAPDNEQEWRSDVAELFTLLVAFDAESRDLPDLRRSSSHENAVKPLEIDAMVDTLLEFAAGIEPGQRLVAGLAIPGRWPLPVTVQVSMTSPSAGDLLDSAGCRTGSPIAAPTVDSIDMQRGSSQPDSTVADNGIRVTRFDLDDDGSIWATVRCARRSDGVEAIVTWRTVELELVAMFSPWLEQLLDQIHLERAA